MTKEEQIKKWLNRAYKLDELIQLDKKKLDELEELSTTIGSIEITDKVQTSTSSDPKYLEDILKMDEIRRKLNLRIVERYNIKNEIDEAINSIEDNNIVQILDYRYLQFLKFREIANICYMSIGSIQRLHDKGISIISKKIKIEQEDVR